MMTTAQQQPIRDILADLVAFKTVTGDYEQAAALLSYVRGRLNGHLHEQDFVSNDYPSLILSTQKTARPKVTLQAHIDVVPAEDGQFRLVRDGDKLYGRGVFDMKFALACYIRLVEDLRQDLSSYDFALMLTSDEEVGGLDGVRVLLNQGGYQSGVCILPDAGDDWRIEQQAKGTWHIAIVAEGVTAHASRPWEGTNAAQRIINALHTIQAFHSNQQEATSVAVTTLDAGHARNQIPDNARATIDIRFKTMNDFETIRRRILAAAEQFECRVEPILFIEPVMHEFDNPLMQQFIGIAQASLGKPLEPMLSFGAADVRHFIAKNIPTIVVRPVGGGQHGADEWISEQSMEQFYQVLKHYMQAVARHTATD